MRSCSFFQGTVILTVSSLLIKFLGFFYKIFLAQAMGAEGMGIYQLIFPVFAVCHSLTSSGLEVAISRFTARSRGHEQSDYLWAGLFLTLTSSLVIGLFLWTRSDFIALTLLHETRCAPLLKFLAATIPLAGFHGCFCGFCLGRKNASLPAFSQLTEQAVRICSVWLLYHIFLQEGMEITPMLAAAGLLTGEIASVLFILTFAANKTLLPSSLSACFHRCRTLLTMSIPVTASRVSLTLLQSVEAVLIPLSLRQSGLSSTKALSLYGILTGMSLSFLLFPNAVTSSLSAMLLPVISEEQAKGNVQKISQAIEYTLLFGMNIGILCMGIFLRFGKELGTLCFHQPLAGEFLQTLAWICPFLYLSGNLSSILHGLGKTSVTFFNQLAALLVRIFCIVLFVPFNGIQGVLWGLLASELLLSFLDIRSVASYVTPSIGLDAYVLKPAAAILLSMGGIHMLKPAASILGLFFQIALMGLGYVLLLFSFGVWKLLRPLFYVKASK